MWQRQIKGAIYTRVLLGKPLDGDQVLRIREAAQKVSTESTQAFVVVEKPVEDSGWLQIAALRAVNFSVIPIPSTLLYENQTSSRTIPEGLILAKHLERFLGQGTDPYDVRIPVFDVLNFFGRESLARNLKEQLAVGSPLGLFGLRKIGKSSLTRYMQSILPWPTAWVDLQAGMKSVDLYQRILRAWTKDSKDRLNFDLPLNDTKITSHNSMAGFVKATQKILDKLVGQLSDARLVILLDEIEWIVSPIDSTGPVPDGCLSLLRTLRGLVQEDGRVSLMVTGVEPSINRISRLGNKQNQNPFFEFLREVYLPPLLHSDCIQMVRNVGRQVGLSYNDETATYVTQESGGHPFLARQLCSLAYQERQQQAGDVSLVAIQKATDHFLFNPKYASFVDQALWSEISNARQWGEQIASANQAILLVLAQSADPVAESILRAGPDQIMQRSALDILTQLCIIHPVDKLLDQPDPKYVITFGLFKSWIRRVRLGLAE